MSGHLYSAPMQDATDYQDAIDGDAHVRCKPNAMRYCWRCRKRRRAKNLFVQVFYDGARHWCRNNDCSK